MFGTQIDPIPKETFDDFKTLMMYFNEPFLSGVSIKELFFYDMKSNSLFRSNVFESSFSSIMAKALTKTILSGLDKFTTETADFEVYLNSGVAVMNMINSTYDVTKMFPASSQFERIQAYIISAIEMDGKIVIPSGWSGFGPHAIGLIFEKGGVVSGTGEEAVNLIVVNSGDGLQFHYRSSDPNGHYPFLARLWIEFKGIPVSEIFSDDCWFVRALAALKSSELMRKIEAVSGSGPQYFYGSILANLRKYLVVPDPADRDKLAPPQRSGSCSLSSLFDGVPTLPV